MNTHVSPYAILFSVCVAQFVLPFMMAGVNAVLPPIGVDTGASVYELSLLSTFYALGLAIFQLTSGRMGDVWGRRRIFLYGMSIFIVCSAILGCLNHISALLPLRFIQGSGAAMFNASGLAILASVAPPGMRGRFLGFSGAAVYAGIACGPPVAGLVAGALSWRWLFWGNAVAGVMAWCLMFFIVRCEWYAGKDDPFDWRGGIVYGLGMAALTFGSTSLQGSALMGWGLLGAGVGILALYVWLELRTRYPMLDVRLLVTNRVFGLSALAAFVNYSASFGILFFFSLYLQVVRGMDVVQAGLYLSPQFIVQAVSTPWAGYMADRYGASRISAIGIGLCGLGLLAASFLEQDTPFRYLMAVQVLLGLGISLFAIPNTSVILESAGPGHVGQAAGLTGTVRTAGGLLNMIIISTTLGAFLGGKPVGPDTVEPFLQSMKVDLMIFSLLNLAAVGCALGRLRAIKTRPPKV